MHAAIATQAGSPESENEDWAGVAAPGLAVVLDGLSAPDGTGTGVVTARRGSSASSARDC
jgi:hypothetical protein